MSATGSTLSTTLFPVSARAPSGEAHARACRAAVCKLQRNGLSPGGVHHVDRTIRAALNEAVRRSHLSRKPRCSWRGPRSWPNRKSSRTASRRSRVCWGRPASGATAPGGLLTWNWDCGRGRHWDCAGRTWTWTTACSASAVHGYGPDTRTASLAAGPPSEPEAGGRRVRAVSDDWERLVRSSYR